jgi:hypothetical protein
MVGRVGDREKAVQIQPVGEQVVEHTAVLAAEDAVLRAAYRHLRDVVGEQALQQHHGLGAARFDLAHVRDVEDPARAANRHVLLTEGGRASIEDGHLPAGEVDHLRPRRHVTIEQRGTQQGRRHRLRLSTDRASPTVRETCGGTAQRRLGPLGG